jgi:hypothetical protein
MKEDILVQIAVEKIREDFGDYCASIFNIISLNRGCSFIDLNKFIQTSYTIIRSSIFLLFKNNLLYIENDCMEKNGPLFLCIKLFSNVKEAVNRFNYFRYIIFTEVHYGNIGSKIIGFLLSNGQAFCNKLLKPSHDKRMRKYQNILIHLARDNFIKIAFCPSEMKSFSNDRKGISFKTFENKIKPCVHNDQILWKVNSENYNSGIKKKILIEAVRETITSRILAILKISLSKILNLLNEEIQILYFSFDTIIDIYHSFDSCREIDEFEILNEIEIQSHDIFHLKLLKYYLYWDFNSISNLFFEKLSENIIFNQLGKNFYKIFCIFKYYSCLSINRLKEFTLMSEKNIRKIIYFFFRSGILYFDEKKNLTKENKKNVYYWTMDFAFLNRKLFSGLLKAFYNIYIRKNNLELFDLNFYNTDENKYREINLKKLKKNNNIELSDNILLNLIDLLQLYL